MVTDQPPLKAAGFKTLKAEADLLHLMLFAVFKNNQSY